MFTYDSLKDNQPLGDGYATNFVGGFKETQVSIHNKLLESIDAIVENSEHSECDRDLMTNVLLGIGLEHYDGETLDIKIPSITSSAI